MDFALLSLLFFLVAFIYSMVGFGGGSSYIALLMLSSISYEVAPVIALVCNIIVVINGIFHFTRGKNLNLKLLLPFVITSVPFAYLGGRIPIDKVTFQLILGLCLFVAGSNMIFFKKDEIELNTIKTPPILTSTIIGAFLGFISGLVGIGGGIFLAPILYFFKWGRPKEIATVCAIFIFVNSLSGLFGQFGKSESFAHLSVYWPLFVSVFIAGQFGSYFGAFKISPLKVKYLTALLILFVATRLIFKSISSFA